jgi:hypothetical protein
MLPELNGNLYPRAPSRRLLSWTFSEEGYIAIWLHNFLAREITHVKLRSTERDLDALEMGDFSL